MKYYKEELLRKLSVSDWDLVARDHDTEWWAEEIWTIKSQRQAWGLEIYIYFLVDPQYDGNDKSSAVWQVTADLDKPLQHRYAPEGFSSLYLRKGSFKKNIEEFVKEVNHVRYVKNT